MSLIKIYISKLFLKKILKKIKFFDNFINFL